MTTLLIVWAGLLGAAIGSFLNVCIYRLPRECMSLVHPGSRCPQCLTPIRWSDNIPVLSWLLLAGRCRHCRKPISPRYPLIELLTAGLFAFTAWHQIAAAPAGGAPGPLPGLPLDYADRAILFLVQAYLVSALLVSTFIDFDYRIIPDQITLSGAVLAPVVAGFFPFLHADTAPAFTGLIERLAPGAGPALTSPRLGAVLASLFGELCGGGLIYVIGVFGKLLFRKEAMGLGDVKYMCLLGGFLGWKAALLILVLACLFGAIFGVFIKLVTRDSYIAFGPYLSLGALCMIYWQKDAIHFLFHTWPALLDGGAGS